jgi:HNH endonuclease/AP2 domain
MWSIALAKCNDITAELARQLLDYNPETGVFRWKARTPGMFIESPGRTAVHKCRNWNARYAGKEAGYRHKSGYVTVAIWDKAYYVHHLAWLIMTGDWPFPGIDHRNRIPWENWFDNLRLATQVENGQNCKKSKNNTSGFIGVSWSRVAKRWHASITKDYRAVHLGYFDTPEEAHEAYKAAKRRLHTFQPELIDNALPFAN